MFDIRDLLDADSAAEGGDRDVVSDGGQTAPEQPAEIAEPELGVAGVRSDLDQRQRDRLAELLSDLAEVDRRDAADRAEAYAKEGADSAAFAQTYRDGFEQLTDSVFDLVREGRVDEAERAMRAGLDAGFDDLTAGLSTYDGLAGRDDEYADAVLSIETLLEAIPFPIYILDADNRVIGWNYGHTALVGMSREEAIGKTARESVVKATYSEGARKLTLADKVIDSPHNAHNEYDIERDETPYCDGMVYYDTSTATNLEDETVEIEFWAIPIFEDGELIAVFEILNDRTDEVRRREGLESLVGEITRTLQGIGSGDLTARAEYENETGAVDEELLDIVTEVNSMAEEFQSLVGDVNERTADLAASIREAADDAQAVESEAADQRESLEQAAEEIQDFSAAMEEIASTSSEVASAAKQARAEVDSGLSAAHSARSVADEMSDTSQDLVETVSQLADRMDQIEEVASVIDDIADQTNMLALNANIEAARAGTDGEGFAVVADEVKDLADETQAYTGEISDHIERIKAQSQETVDAVEHSHERVAEVDEEIDNAVQSFEEIDDAVDAAANGIEEVADANDDQAARIEKVLSIVEDAQADAERVAESATRIVDRTDSQRADVDDLQDTVDELSK